MAKKIVIQRKGQTMKEGTIGRWLKKNGDTVKVGDAIYELEYDKATCEIEASAEGILHILAEEGSTLPVGSLIGEILKDGEVGDDNSRDECADAQAVNSKTADTKEKTEYGISASAKRIIRQKGLDAVKITPANGKRIMEDDVIAFVKSLEEQNHMVRATPLARKIAAENDVNLEDIASGNTGVKIAAADVESYLAPVSVPEESRMPLSAMRRVIVKNMMRSYFSIPAVTYSMEVDCHEALKLRRELNEEYASRGVKVSINDMILKAAAAALKRSPNMNVSLDGEEIVCHKEIHVGMAVSVPGGLVVPVVKDTDKLTLDELAKETRRLIDKAMAGTLTGDEMAGGTFTVSNLGSKGVDMFTPIINGSQAAILGVGRVQEKPVVIEGKIEIRPMMVLSLTADHRMIDGAPAADFLSVLKHILERPVLMFV